MRHSHSHSQSLNNHSWAQSHNTKIKQPHNLTKSDNLTILHFTMLFYRNLTLPHSLPDSLPHYDEDHWHVNPLTDLWKSSRLRSQGHKMSCGFLQELCIPLQCNRPLVNIIIITNTTITIITTTTTISLHLRCWCSLWLWYNHHWGSWLWWTHSAVSSVVPSWFFLRMWVEFLLNSNSFLIKYFKASHTIFKERFIIFLSEKVSWLFLDSSKFFLGHQVKK